MTKKEIIQKILKNSTTLPVQQTVSVFAPINIALCKYWGKRDLILNLPIQSSLSLTMPKKGVTTQLTLSKTNCHRIIINNQLTTDPLVAQPIENFLDAFRGAEKSFAEKIFFELNFDFNIPVAAGLASSACTYASIVLALNELFQWKLTAPMLSILARLGSGSACRSIEEGFVEWQCGSDPQGMDSYGYRLPDQWPELCMDICFISKSPKKISSRQAMQQTLETSLLYKIWPEQAQRDLLLIKQAIVERNFKTLGETAENNALTMHATMLAARPAIIYSEPETLRLMQKIWKLRDDGLELYFTQDAGPNLKLLYLAKDSEEVRRLLCQT